LKWSIISRFNSVVPSLRRSSKILRQKIMKRLKTKKRRGTMTLLASMAKVRTLNKKGTRTKKVLV